MDLIRSSLGEKYFLQTRPEGAFNCPLFFLPDFMKPSSEKRRRLQKKTSEGMADRTIDILYS